MTSFFSAVAWYYLVATLFFIFSTIKDKSAGKDVNFDDVNLDISVISVIYLIYYYTGILG